MEIWWKFHFGFDGGDWGLDFGLGLFHMDAISVSCRNGVEVLGLGLMGLMGLVGLTGWRHNSFAVGSVCGAYLGWRPKCGATPGFAGTTPTPLALVEASLLPEIARSIFIFREKRSKGGRTSVVLPSK